MYLRKLSKQDRQQEQQQRMNVATTLPRSAHWRWMMLRMKRRKRQIAISSEPSAAEPRWNMKRLRMELRMGFSGLTRLKNHEETAPAIIRSAHA